MIIRKSCLRFSKSISKKIEALNRSQDSTIHEKAIAEIARNTNAATTGNGAGELDTKGLIAGIFQNTVYRR